MSSEVETSPPVVARRRLVRHHLVGPPLASPEAVVRHLVAVQAQDYLGATWGIAQRTTPTTAAAVDALLDSGALLRTHLLRPTWHLVLPEDIRWLLALTAHRVHRANAYMYRTLALGDALFARTDNLIVDALRHGAYRTRKELQALLAEHGIAAEGLRLGYVLMHAELGGYVCSGPRRGKQHTYALLDERAPTTAHRTREEALAELARRFLASRAPAAAHDLATWSGLTVADARAGLAALGADAFAETIEGATYWSPSTDAPSTRSASSSPTVHLLPNYDEYVAGYKDDAPILAPALKARLAAAPTALDAHLIVVDGQVVGGWRREVKGRSVTLHPTLLRPLAPAEQAAFDEQVERYGRFLGASVTVLDANQA